MVVWLGGGVTQQLLFVLTIGAAIGFMGGLMGKGGSAVATPLLVAIGIPPVVALAAPLPATVPATMAAAGRYRRHGHVDRSIVGWSIAAGVPATIVGALLTRWVDASSLITVTEVIILGLGLRMLLAPGDRPISEIDLATRRRTIGVAVVTGLAAGLLANSGGFLLAPLFVAVLGLPIKSAFGTSLVVASAMAVPASAVHFALGHLDLAIVAVFALGSIPFSTLGAKVALATDSSRLERGYGAVLVAFGAVFLAGAVI